MTHFDLSIRGARHRKRELRGQSAVLAVVAALTLAGCTSSSAPKAPTTSTRTVTLTRTPTARAYTPAPATSVHPLTPGAKPRAGEVAKSCPYIKAGLDIQPTSGPNVADIEGDRIYRQTVLTSLHPVGCRFYFWAPPFEATADVLPTTFATATQAHNAMVLTADAGRNAQARPHFAAGADGILYQTRFFGPDGDSDWAFVFAKGRVMVVVHTQQTNSPLNAQLLAEAIVGKF